MFNKPFLRERESVTDSISLSLSVCVCVYVCLALAGLELDIQLALDSHRSTCLCLLSGGIKNVCHYRPAIIIFLRSGYIARLALNSWHSCLRLLSAWDFRHRCLFATLTLAWAGSLLGTSHRMGTRGFPQQR